MREIAGAALVVGGVALALRRERPVAATNVA